MKLQIRKIIKWPILRTKIPRAGFEPATYGYLSWANYSPPLYQLSYRGGLRAGGGGRRVAGTVLTTREEEEEYQAEKEEKEEKERERVSVGAGRC